MITALKLFTYKLGSKYLFIIRIFDTIISHKYVKKYNYLISIT